MVLSPKQRKPLLVALSGPSGAGKSTFAILLARQLRRQKCRVKICRIADPLYAAQRVIYRLAGREANPVKFQDTLLLSFLGAHFRRINKNSLLKTFALKMQKSKNQLMGAEASAIICADARTPDLPQLRRLGFTMVYVGAPRRTISQRIKKRGDANPIHADPKLEIIKSRWVWDHSIENAGSLDDLSLRAAELASRLAAQVS